MASEESSVLLQVDAIDEASGVIADIASACADLEEAFASVADVGSALDDVLATLATDFSGLSALLDETTASLEEMSGLTDDFAGEAANLDDSLIALNADLLTTQDALDSLAAEGGVAFDALIAAGTRWGADTKESSATVVESMAAVDTSVTELVEKVNEGFADITAQVQETATKSDEAFTTMDDSMSGVANTFTGDTDRIVEAITAMRDDMSAILLQIDADLSSIDGTMGMVADSSEAMAEKMTASAGAAADAQKALRDSTEATAGSTAEAGSVMGTLFSIPVLGATAALYESVKASTDYNKQVMLLKGNMQTTTAGANQVAGALQNMANTSEFVTSGAEGLISSYNSVVAELQQYYGVTLSASQATQFMTQAQEIATGTGTSLAAATTTLATSLILTKTPLADVSSAADQLYNINRVLGNNFSNTASMVQMLQSRLGGLNIPLDQVGATMIALQHAGVAGSMGMRTAGEAIKSLAAPSLQQQEILQRLGVTWQTTNGQFIGMSSLLGQLKSKMDALPESTGQVGQAIQAQFAQAQESIVSASESVTQADSAMQTFNATNSSIMAEQKAMGTSSAAGMQTALADYVRFSQEELAAQNQMNQLKTEKSTTTTNVVKANLQAEIAALGQDQLALSKTSVMTTLFGGNAQLLNSVIQQGGAQFSTYTAEVDKAGTAHKAAADAASSAEIQWTVFLHQLQSVSITIGNALIPVFAHLFGALNTVLLPIVTWIDNNKQLVADLGILALSIGTVVSAMLLMSKASNVFSGMSSLIDHFGGKAPTLDKIANKLESFQHPWKQLGQEAINAGKAVEQAIASMLGKMGWGAAQDQADKLEMERNARTQATNAAIEAKKAGASTTEQAETTQQSAGSIQAAAKEMSTAMSAMSEQVTTTFSELASSIKVSMAEIQGSFASLGVSENQMVASTEGAAIEMKGVTATMGEGVIVAAAESETGFKAIGGAAEEAAVVETEAGAVGAAGLATMTAGLTLLIPVILYVATHWKQIWSDIKTVLSDAVSFVKSHMLMVALALAPLTGGLSLLALAGYELVTHWHQIWTDVQHWTTDAIDAVKNAIGDVVNWIKAHWMLLLEIFTAPFSLILAAILRFHAQILSFFQTALSDIEKVIEVGLHAAYLWFVQWPLDVLKAVAGFGSLLINTGEHLIEGLIKGVGDAAKNLPGTMEKVAKNMILSPIKSILHIFSPSQVMADEIGAPIMAGIAQGMAGASGLTTAQVQKTFQTLTVAFTSIVKPLQKLQAPLADFGKSMKPLPGDVTATMAPVQKFSKMIEALSPTLSGLLPSLNKFSTGLSVVAPKITSSAKGLDAATPSLKDFAKTLAANDTSPATMAKSLDKMNTSMDNISKTLGGFVKSLGKSDGTLADINKGLLTTNKAFTGLVSTTTAVLKPMAGLAKTLSEILIPLQNAIDPWISLTPLINSFAKAIGNLAKDLTLFNVAAATFATDTTAMAKASTSFTKAITSLVDVSKNLTKPLDSIVISFQHFATPMVAVTKSLGGATGPLNTFVWALVGLANVTNNELNKPLSDTAKNLVNINKAAGEIQTNLINADGAMVAFQSACATLLGPKGLPALSGQFQTIGNEFIITFSPIPKTLEPVSRSFQSLATDVTSFWVAVTSTSKTNATVLTKDFSTATQNIGVNWSNTWTGIQTTLKNAFSSLEPTLKADGTTVADAWGTAMSNMTSSTQTMVTRVTNLLSGMAATLATTSASLSAEASLAVSATTDLNNENAAATNLMTATTTGTGGTNVNVYVTGNTVMSDADIQKLASRVSTAITKALPGAGVHIRH